MQGRLVLAFLMLLPVHSAAQMLPPPRDGDIRTAYFELRNESEMWLTIEPRSPDGKLAPPLTLTYRFSGKQPTQRPTQLELRANAGRFWAPRADLSLVVDDQPLLDPSSAQGTYSESALDSVFATLSIGAVEQIARARRVTGSALGFPFALSTSQIAAVRAFLDRVR
jgi:hypothetical protein